MKNSKDSLYQIYQMKPSKNDFAYFSLSREYEMKLRTNDGPDPLELWHEYITWTEQNFPKGGKDANLHTLLEKCITQFKEDTKSCQDPRYLDVWVKYVS